MFENHFIHKKNVIFERYKFNSRALRTGESIELFITALHSLAENCEYGALKRFVTESQRGYYKFQSPNRQKFSKNAESDSA